MTIQQKCGNLNTEIHERLFKNHHFDSSFGHYEQTFISIDQIEDCQDAIDEFNSLRHQDSSRSILAIYGLLQALYGQQDGLHFLFRSLSGQTEIKLQEFFGLFEFSMEIREVRNDIVGHPSNRNNGKEFYFIAKGPNSKYEFEYGGYKPNFVRKHVDLKKFIQQQDRFAHTVLDELRRTVSKTVQFHKDKHKMTKLIDLISSLNYPIQLMKRGYYDTQRSFQAEWGISEVNSKIIQLKNELEIRYNNQIPEGIADTFRIIDLILNKMQHWHEKGALLGNEDAEIFMYAFDNQFEQLEEMVKEIDEKYSS